MQKNARAKISPLVSVTLHSYLSSISRIAWIDMTKAKRPAALMPRSDEDIDWETIRVEYDIGMRSLAEIALEHRITTQKIVSRATREDWPKRGQVTEKAVIATALADDAGALAERLTKLIAREIADLEQQRKTMRDEAEGERQARRLSTLIRSIEKLHEIEQAARRAKKDDPAADAARRRKEDEALRGILEGKLARLAAAGEAARLSGKADAEGSGASCA
jgi:hypothetical protein